MSTNDTTVLVVDDDPRIADGYAERLRERYAVRTAYGGEEALEAVDETVDVVLLDRRMPDLSGDEVLAELRRRGLSCQVALLTAVEPDFDIVDMELDAYITKPVSRTELLETVESLQRRVDWEETLRKHFSTASKLAALEAEYPEEALREREQYLELRRELERLRQELDETLADLSYEEGYVLAGRKTVSPNDYVEGD